MGPTIRQGIIAIALLLGACGGSGGPSEPPANPTPTLQMFAGTWGPPASVDGTGSAANFYFILDMAFDAEGNLLVLDGAVRKVTPAAQATTLAMRPFSTVAVDETGQAYVGEWQFGTCRLGICSFGGSLNRMSAAGATTSLLVIRSAYGLVAANGDLYWADAQSQVIRRLAATNDVTTLAGIENSFGSEDGPATTARFKFPQGLAIDANRNFYVADSSNHTIRKIAADGMVTTLAGAAGLAGSIDGPGPLARFNNPTGIALDSAGNLYIADTGNCTVRRMDAQRVVTTVAGTPGACDSFVGGALPGALNSATHVAVRGSDLYIAMAHGIAVVHNRP